MYYEDKIFRTKFDKEAYLNGAKAYKIDDKNYYIVDSALDDIIKINKEVYSKGDECYGRK